MLEFERMFQLIGELSNKFDKQFEGNNYNLIREMSDKLDNIFDGMSEQLEHNDKIFYQEWQFQSNELQIRRFNENNHNYFHDNCLTTIIFIR